MKTILARLMAETPVKATEHNFHLALQEYWKERRIGIAIVKGVKDYGLAPFMEKGWQKMSAEEAVLEKWLLDGLKTNGANAKFSDAMLRRKLRTLAKLKGE